MNSSRFVCIFLNRHNLFNLSGYPPRLNVGVLLDNHLKSNHILDFTYAKNRVLCTR